MPKPPLNLPAEPRIRRILVIKWSAMGDVVISTALFDDLRRAFPQAEIDLNTLPPWDRLLFAEDPRFAQVHAVDLRGKEGGWRGTFKWLRLINARRYDLLVDLQSNDRSRLLVALLYLFGRRIRWRLGNHRRWPYNVAPAPATGVIHPFTLQQQTLQAAGIATDTPRPSLHIPERNRQRARQFMQEHGLQAGDYAVFLPGSQAAGWLKRWGAQRYAALARLLLEAGLQRVVLCGGKDELEECRQIAQQGGEGIVNLCGCTEIQDLVPLCAAARVIIGNDTGTAHVASCTDRPMLVVCGPTDPRRVKPVGANVIALQAPLDCINCYCKQPCEHHSCMAAITPQQVLATLRPYLT